MINFSLIFPTLVLLAMMILRRRGTIFGSKDNCNAGQNGIRKITVSPDTTTSTNKNTAMKHEAGAATRIDLLNILRIVIPCGNSGDPAVNNAQLAESRSEKIIRLTIPFNYNLRSEVCFSKPITISRSMETVKS